MPKLVRFIQKIFGDTAGANERAVFGSLAEGAPNFSTNVKTIQSLAPFSAGWFNAVLGNNSPAIQDRNALDYVMTYQLAYLLESGIAEWDADTNYFTKSKVSQGNGTEYQSLIDDNEGNPLTDVSKWRKVFDSNNVLAKTSLKNFSEISDGSLVTSAVLTKDTLTYAPFPSGRGMIIGGTDAQTVNKFYRNVISQVALPVGFDSIACIYENGVLFVTNKNMTTNNIPYLYSTDGVTYNSAAVTGLAAGYPTAVGKGGGKVLMIIDGTPDVIFIDTATPAAHIDGNPLPGPVSNATIAFGNGIFMVAADDLGIPDLFLQTTPDGINWTDILGNIAYVGSITSPLVAYGNGIFVVTFKGDTVNPGDSIFSFVSRDDGATFTPFTVDFEDDTIDGINIVTQTRFTFVNGYFVLTSSTTGDAYISENGETWDIARAQNSLHDVVYSDVDKMGVSISTGKLNHTLRV